MVSAVLAIGELKICFEKILYGSAFKRHKVVTFPYLVNSNNHYRRDAG